MVCITEDPHVCCRFVISKFGGIYYGLTDTTGNSSETHPSELTTESLSGEIKDFMVNHDKYLLGFKKSFNHWESKYIEKMAVFEATTSDKQVKAEAALAALGFTQVGPFEKLKHGNSKLSIWIIHAPLLMKNVGYKGLTEEQKKGI